MAAYSKYLTCYEVGHTWTPYCTQATLDVAKSIYVESFKVYASLYLLAAVLQQKKWYYYTQKMLPDILRSTFFLGTNGTLFLAMVCVWRKLLGRFHFVSIGFLPAAVGSFVAIICERKYRRGMLALYVTNLSVETMFKSAVSRELIKPIKHGEVLLFSLACAGCVYLFRSNSDVKDPIRNGFRFLVGSSELPSGSSKDIRVERKAQTTRPNRLPKPIIALLAWIKQGPRHDLCLHRHACIYSILKGSTRMFVVGSLAQIAMRLIPRLSLLWKQPRQFFQLLVNKDNFQLGAFLGFFVGLFKTVSCGLRWGRGRESPLHGLLAGFCAGSSMIFYPSSTVALYLASKLCEMIYFRGIAAGLLPHIKWADIAIYTFSTAILLHSVVFEPHNIRPAYWRFLLRITGGRFALVNRKLVDVFGFRSSTISPDFWPKYDQRFSSLKNAN